ncbi:MAG: saccharopine dehydrogenase NADP-binding domain-containing protein [Alphaproteobacteria bacterium]|nr:saccharopine dehydrogenase NADP-binding domain-containing protein [Alphaproteobacteria bacterium]
MPKRILIIGGYGNFGQFIACRLARHQNIELIIAGRREHLAARFATSLKATNPVHATRIDINDGLAASLEAIRPDLVIHTSGPFQEQGYDVAEACVKAGAHYIDLSDGRAFVAGISAIDDMAKAASVSVISGASSVPALSGAVMDAHKDSFKTLTHLDYGITTAQATTRGLATTAAIMGYAGKPFTRLEGGEMCKAFGWQGVHGQTFKGLGTRYLANCDIPDLSLFPTRYPTLKTQRFYAGLEIPLLHFGLWGLTWLVRMRLIKSLRPFTATLLKMSFLFDFMGTDTSAFYMRLRGLGKDGTPREVRFDLTARSGDGPFIPCMPAIILAERFADGNALPPGSMPCVGLITLEEYLDALNGLDIQSHTDTI